MSDSLPKLMERYDPHDVFNADEAGLFWRMLPDKTMAMKGDKCQGGKKSKECITLLVGANMDESENCHYWPLGSTPTLDALKVYNASCL